MNIELAPSALSRSLRQMNLDLSSAYASEVIGVLGADSTGKLGFVNPTAAKLIRIFAWELIGRNIHEFMRLETRDADSHWPQDQLKSDPDHVVATAMIIDRDGKETHNLTAVANPVFDEYDQVCGTLVLFCKLSVNACTRHLFDQIVQLDHLLRKLRQEKLRLIMLSEENSVIDSMLLNQIVRSVETLESNVSNIIQQLFNPNVSLE
jgi:PAS domain-containing protein